MFKNFKLVAQPSRLHTGQTTNFMFVESTRQPSLSIIGDYIGCATLYLTDVPKRKRIMFERVDFSEGT